MKRSLTRISQLGIDLISLALAFVLAFQFRFDWAPPADLLGRMLLVTPYVVALEYFVLVGFGVHRYSWRYIGLREVGRVLAAMVFSTLLLALSRALLGHWAHEVAYLRHGVVPYGVIAVNLTLSFGAIVGVRVTRRLVGERSDRRSEVVPPGREPVATLLIGAGQAGVMVARELRQRPDLFVLPVGFVDDDAVKRGTVIHGVPVVGVTEDVPRLAAELGARQALITMANVPGSVVRRIRTVCEDAGLPVKIIPGLYEIVGGQVNLSRIRDVAIEDLLGREPVDLDLTALESFLEDRVVLVTGAGGSIGSELCRQIARFNPRKLVLVEQAEGALFEIHRELQHLGVVPLIADVTDVARMESIFARHRPHAVFHAAAHKHVPMMEWNPGEAIKNNVGGSKIVADMSHRFGCDSFVMVSTDKAVNPTSVMGATKRIAELYVQTVARQSSTRFVTVRFGNVLGSNGSVVPIFREQIARGGPVTVTHPEMSRYFMTIPEACQLVLQAGSMGEGGEIFVLDMGEPVRIVDLARDLIALSGLREGDDIEVVFSGCRPGEKLFEELATDAEHATRTKHPKIYIGNLAPAEPEVQAKVTSLLLMSVEGKSNGFAELLRAIVPEYTGGLQDPDPVQQSSPSPVLAVHP